MCVTWTKRKGETPPLAWTQPQNCLKGAEFLWATCQHTLSTSQSDHPSREFLLSQLRSMCTSGCGLVLIPITISMLKLNDNLKLKDTNLMGSYHLPREVRQRNLLSKTLKTLLAPVAHRIVRKGCVLGTWGTQWIFSISNASVFLTQLHEVSRPNCKNINIYKF